MQERDCTPRRGSTHAWCQIYLPGSGWIEFDPTNGIVGNRDLIRVAVTRTPNQAIPLSGSYWGNGEDELGMDVTVGDNVAGIVRHRGYGNANEANRLSLWEEERAGKAFHC